MPAIGAVDTALPTPVVVVYPFSITAGVSDPEAGGRLAVLFASRLAAGRQPRRPPGNAGHRPRPHFLDDARKIGADYYVTGYLTPLGDEVSLVDQIVSTHSGIVVWSTTTQVRTYDEALGQTDLMRDAITALRGPHAGRTRHTRAAFTFEPEPAAERPEPQQTLRRHTKATPAPASPRDADPTPPSPPAPAPAHPPSRSPPARANPAAAVVAIGGDASAQDRPTLRARSRLRSRRPGSAARWSRPATRATSPPKPTSSAPEPRRSRSTAAPFRSSTNGRVRAHASANFELVRYDCAGAVTTGSAPRRPRGPSGYTIGDRSRGRANARGGAGSAQDQKDLSFVGLFGGRVE